MRREVSAAPDNRTTEWGENATYEAACAIFSSRKPIFGQRAYLAAAPVSPCRPELPK
jgi:hypothetical protein